MKLPGGAATWLATAVVFGCYAVASSARGPGTPPNGRPSGRTGAKSADKASDRTLTAKTVDLPARSRWEAMVINLHRRPERLGRFLEAVRTNEPWLLEGGQMCRVEGRDGKELPSDPGRVKQWVGGSAPDVSMPVIGSLRDAATLVRDGWVTATALADAESSSDSFWPNMTAGGLGLFLGHAAAWQHVVSANLDYGLVFEDDLTLFSPTFHDNVSSALAGGALLRPGNASGSRWDLLYLQRCDDEAWPKERVWQPSQRDRTPPEVVPVAEHANVTCTGAYVVSRAGAQKLLRGMLPARLQLDKQLSYVPGLVRAALSPPVAQCQEIFKSKAGGRYRDTDVQNKGDNLPEIVSNMAAAMDAAANRWLKTSASVLGNRGLRGVWSDSAGRVFGRRDRRESDSDVLRRFEKLALLHEAASIPSCGA